MALKLWYEKEAPHVNDDFYDWDWNHPRPDDDGWEKWSLPLGNGYMGVNVFGRTKTERFQITENSLSNPVVRGNGGLGA
ncbi:MAG: glycoside hydrolase N-terminal domain-containing protein, partial [Clostridiales bacterium]|nr:glycoside hydrolase N-terminal domain-containing protein [Clostridiales bacterium]